MKRLLTYTLLLLTGLMYSCNEQDDPIFDDPDARLSAVLTEYSKAITEAPNGWKTTIYPKGGKGFSYYMSFDDKGRVIMLSDFNVTTAKTMEESSYRLKALQRPTLIFDTYNYIHLPHDPNETVSGGTRGAGLASDFQFAIERVTPDSIYLEGTVNGNQMIMVKATPEEKAAFLAGDLKKSFDISTGYILANKNPYVQFADGRRLSLQLDMTSKQATLSYADETDTNVSSTTPFSITLKGIYLSKPLTYGDDKVQELFWDATANTYYFMSGGKRVNLQNSPTPIIPFRILLGAGKDYSTIQYNPASIPANLSADFAAKYNAAKTGLAAVGNANRRLDYIRVIFTLDNTMILRFFYTNTAGTAFQANFTYEVTKEANGNLKFRYLSADGNAGVVGGGLVSLRDYFSDNTFRIDWVANPTTGTLLGGLYTVADPTSFFYGSLIK